MGAEKVAHGQSRKILASNFLPTVFPARQHQFPGVGHSHDAVRAPRPPAGQPKDGCPQASTPC